MAPLLERLPVVEGVAQWPVWSTTARLVVTDPAVLEEARALVEAELAAVDLACSRFRPDSELARHSARGGVTTPVSPLLAQLVDQALLAARRTDGDVDPTLGEAMSALGYDREVARTELDGVRVVTVVRERHDWREVLLEVADDGTALLTAPQGAVLDLGATAKAVAADRCAALVARRCGTGVLVALGGDVATAGPPPPGGWSVLVQDGDGEPACTVVLPAGGALATSSTRSRRWRCGTRLLHHVLDPRTLQPAAVVWRTASVAAASCAEANTASTAALVRGHAALPWLRGAGTSARLVTTSGDVVTTGAWPTGARAGGAVGS